MKTYLVTMYNCFGCDIASDIVLAYNEEQALHKWIIDNKLIIYSGDKFDVVEY